MAQEVDHISRRARRRQCVALADVAAQVADSGRREEARALLAKIKPQ